MYIFELVFIHLTPYGLEKIQNDSNVCIQFLFLGIKDVSCTVIPFKKSYPWWVYVSFWLQLYLLRTLNENMY